jgi:hypothetical protein
MTVTKHAGRRQEAEIRVMPGEDLVPEYKRLTVAAGVTRIDAGTFKLRWATGCCPSRVASCVGWGPGRSTTCWAVIPARP